MSAGKATQGPWRVHEGAEYQIVAPDGADGEPGRLVAEIACDEDGLTAEEEANAHLVAAAPDLRDALSEASPLLCAYGCSGSLHTSACKAVKAALAKARVE